MKQRLTFWTSGSASFTSSLDGAQAEACLRYWRGRRAGEPDSAAVLRVEGSPVFNIALDDIVAITEEDSF